MLTPFDVEEEIEKAKLFHKQELRIGPGTARRRFFHRRYSLYLCILKEISNGSIDPKTLASTALKMEKLKSQFGY